MAPAVAMAYEEGEDFIMEIPPRTNDNHLISPMLMINAYGAVGMLETICAYVSFFIYADKYGITLYIPLLKVFHVSSFSELVEISTLTTINYHLTAKTTMTKCV
jgi:magnesium-transporting ATPase (P-type)